MFTQNARRIFIGSMVGAALVLAPSVALNQTTPASAGAPARSALEAYPGFRIVDADLDDAAFDREDRARQNLIVKCMVAKGMQYKPQYSLTVDSSADTDVERKGPNDDYVTGLTSGQRVAYYRALYGMDDPDALDQPQVAGCLGEAHARIPGVFALRGKLNPDLVKMRQQIAQDPATVGAERTWSACMGAGGHAYASDRELSKAADLGLAGSAKARLFDQRTCSAPLAKARDTVRLAWESQFVRDHRSELDSHKAAWESTEMLVSEHQ